MPVAMIAIKVRINGSFKTFFKMISSGSEIAITDIIKASAVPNGTPFSINAQAIGTAPGEQAYSGIPIKTANGTEYQVDLLINEAR